MSRLKNALTTTAILAGSSVALLTGGIANAEPAPVPVPPQIPGLSMIQSLPALGPQLLQAASQAFTGPATPALPATPPSLATASVNLPAQTAAVPAAAGIPGLAPAATGIPGLAQTTGIPGVAQTTGIPGLAPAAPVAAPAAVPAANPLIPTGEITLPSVPGLPVPLPQRISFPGDLGAVMPAGSGPVVTQPGVAPAASATSPLPGIGALFPAYALP